MFPQGRVKARVFWQKSKADGATGLVDGRCPRGTPSERAAQVMHDTVVPEKSTLGLIARQVGPADYLAAVVQIPRDRARATKAAKVLHAFAFFPNE